MGDIVVEILKYGKLKKPENPNGFTRGQLNDHLKKLGYKLDHEEAQVLDVTISNCFILNAPSEGRYIMKAEGYFTLLEYEELAEARASSRQANHWAIIALCVTLITSGISIGISLKQMNSPIKIDADQHNQLLIVFENHNRAIDSLLVMNRALIFKLYASDTSKSISVPK